MDRLDGWADIRTRVYMCITDSNEDEKEGICLCVKTEGQTSPPGVSLTA